MTIFTDDPMTAFLPAQRRALIIHPGGLGDTLLALPLANFIKTIPDISSIDLMAHEQYGGILRGRSVYEQVLDLDRVELHRMFTEPGGFSLPDRDPLINLFGRYGLIVTLLADKEGWFEANLIFTANMSQPCEVVTLPLRPEENYPGHVAEFYLNEFFAQFPDDTLPQQKKGFIEAKLHCKPTDRMAGEAILGELSVNPSNCLVIHPGSGGQEKCWPIKNFEKLTHVLCEEGWDVVMVVGPAEQERMPEQITRLSAQLPVIKDLETIDLLCVLSCAAGFIGNDSGPSHLSGILRIPGVVIFGPTNDANWRPLGDSLSVCRYTVEMKDKSKGASNNWPDVDFVYENLRQSLNRGKNQEKRY